MANVAHASLTGSNVHEPKGIDTATAGQAYLADGLASGAWTTISGLSLTGVVAPWLTPVAPSGWYELNGATISSASDTALYNVMTIQQTGTRVSGVPTISGLSTLTTLNIKPGYYVFGTGITAGTTILSVDSSTDITMSANATSSGSSTIIVSPWQLVSGGIVLPDMTTAGRFLRSRASTQNIGILQSNQNRQHHHAFTTTGDSLSGTVITSSGESQGHTHSYEKSTVNTIPVSAVTGTGSTSITVGVAATTGGVSQGHTHTTTMPGHTHTGTTDDDPATPTEARPNSLVVMFCVKR